VPHQPLRFDPILLAEENWRARGWDDAARGMAVLTSVMRAQQILLSSVTDVLAPYDLTFARYEVLMLLTFSSTGSLPIGKIGARLQVHPASATNAVDRLEEAALVERVANPRDRRGVLVAITRKGRKAATGATAALNDQVFSRLPLSADAMDQLFESLRALRREHGDFETPP